MVKAKRCYFCGRVMRKKVCKCGAYEVDKGYEHLPLKKQPWYKK